MAYLMKTIVSDQLLTTLANELVAHKIVLATAESCTGGWIAKCITDVAGSSQWFDCGIVSYSNQSKIRLLGVSADTLDKHGAVSQAVVEEMALGLLERSEATFSIAVSGIAGPEGGSKDKPVGTVWIAWANSNNKVITQCFVFSGSRDQVRTRAVNEALSGVQRIVTSNSQ